MSFATHSPRAHTIGAFSVLTKEESVEVTSQECMKYMKMAKYQRSGMTKRDAKGAIDGGFTCAMQTNKVSWVRWFFSIKGNALSEEQLMACEPSDRKGIQCHCLMYRRSGTGILDTPLGYVYKSWIVRVEAKLQEVYPEIHQVMHAAVQPVVLTTGEVFDVRIPNVDDNVLFNFTINHHTFNAMEYYICNPSKEMIAVHLDKNDFKNGLAATTDGCGPDPEAIEGGELHIYDGEYAPKKRDNDGKKKKVEVSDLPNQDKIIRKPRTHTAFAVLHDIWHYVSVGKLKKPVDATRWSFIAQQKQDVIMQLAMFRHNPNVYIVNSDQKLQLRRAGRIP